MALVISWLGCGCALSSLDHLQEGDDGSAGEARVESNTGGSSETPNPGSGGSAPGTGGTGSDSPTAGTGPDVSAAGTGTDVSTGGMGPEPSTGGTAGGPDCPLCELQATLIHRYSFNGTGTEATDSVGNAHGTIVDASLDGSGSLTLDGSAESQYVDLPDRIVSVIGPGSYAGLRVGLATARMGCTGGRHISPGPRQVVSSRSKWDHKQLKLAQKDRPPVSEGLPRVSLSSLRAPRSGSAGLLASVAARRR